MNGQLFQGMYRVVRGVLALVALLVPLASWAVATQVDVSGQVTVTKSGLIYNRVTGTYDSTVTLTNSLMPVSGPVRLLLPAITPSSVTLSNATGKSDDDRPYVDVAVGTSTLAPGQSVKTVLKFKNPLRVSFSFTTQVLASVDTGYGVNSVTQAIDAEGGEVELPGVANLTIPAGTVKSTAVQIFETRFPEASSLLSTLPGFVLLSAPSIKIKSSVAFNGPTILRIAVPDLQSQLQADMVPQILAIQPLGDDETGQSKELNNLGGEVCGDGSEVCLLLSQDAFEPIPSDPEDPIISLVVAAGPKPNTATTPLWRLKSQSASPTNPIDATQFVFEADILLGKSFSFVGGPLANHTITSAFKRMRQATDLRSHPGNDLRAGLKTEVYGPLEGTLSVKDQYSEKILLDLISHGNLEGGMSLHTQYLHLHDQPSPNEAQPVQPAKGATVKQGEHFAYTGSSGTTAAHLHFDVKLDGTKIDPRPLLPSVSNVSLYLLPPDDSDLKRGLERSRLGLYLYVNGSPVRSLDELKLNSLFSYSRTFGTDDNTKAEIQNAEIAALMSTETPNGAFITRPDLNQGGQTNVKFRSNVIDLKSILTEEAKRGVGYPDVEEFLAKDKVDVRLLWDNFRFGDRVWELAKWELKAQPSPQHWVGSYNFTPNSFIPFFPQDGRRLEWEAGIALPTHTSGKFYFDDLSNEVIFQGNHASGANPRNVLPLGWTSNMNTFTVSVPIAYHRYPVQSKNGPALYTIDEAGTKTYTFSVSQRTPNQISGTFTVSGKAGYFYEPTVSDFGRNYIENWKTISYTGSGTWYANLVNAPKPQTKMNGFALCQYLPYQGYSLGYPGSTNCNWYALPYGCIVGAPDPVINGCEY